MADKNIPPPNIGLTRGDLKFTKELVFLENENNFSQYLTKSKEQEAKERRNLEDEVREQRTSLKSSMAYEELQEEIRLQAELEQDQLEEETGLEKKGDEKSLKKGQQKVKGQKGRADELEDSEEMRLIQDNQEIDEEGGELEVPIEDDPLQTMKQEVSSEEEVFSDMTKEVPEDVDDVEDPSERKEEVKEKKENALIKKEEPEVKRKMEKRARAPKVAAKPIGGSNKPTEKTKITESESQTIAANALVGKNEFANAAQASEVRVTTLKAKELEELEELAMQLIAEAQVLNNGDVTETTVTLNLADSPFDQGEITITAYKYRPLEVNLKFKKFQQKGVQMLRENVDALKKALKRKSLKVHQLEIIEE